MSDINRIYLIGASVTGKTTLARPVAAELAVPDSDSDDFYHEPTDPPFLRRHSPEGRARIEAGGDMEATHRELMNWTRGYESGLAEGTKTRAAHQRSLRSVKRSVLRLEDPMTTKEPLELVWEALR